jgi:hypothetical protein
VNEAPTRGIRNNNPGNIRKGTDRWQGLAPSKQQTDPAFWIFTGAAWGIRAIAVTLRTYQTKHGLKTLRAMIGRWAPATENATDAYVEDVARRVGESPDAEVSLDDQALLRGVVVAIIRHENGVQPYPPELIDRAMRLARQPG